VFSIVQVRVTATADQKPACLRHTPTTTPFAMDTVKTITGKNKAFNVGTTLGGHSAGPLVGTIAGSWGATSILELNQRRWSIASQRIMKSVQGKQSESVFWRYTHNDVAFKPKRPDKWNYTREFLPSAIYGFEQVPVVEAELMVFWSENSRSHSRKRGFFPLNAKEPPPPVFSNFIYQASVMVDLKTIKDEYSWVTVEDLSDTAKQDDLSKERIICYPEVQKPARKHVETGSESIASTNCHVTIQRAVEGRSRLTDEEINGNAHCPNLYVVYNALIRPY
jgi:hypothetical protein